jgi:hypothetical protein
MRRLVLAPLLLTALALAGCTTTGTTSSKKFSGAAADVAKAVGDIQTAGQRKDADRLCTQLLARSLVEQLDQSGSTCKQEMEKALADADDFKLDVRDVKVSGSEATATVRQGDTGPTRVIQFVREDNRWKASRFSTA